MIDPYLIETIKGKYKTVFKYAFWTLTLLVYFVAMTPSAGFEANVKPLYTGSELRESLPDEYAHLKNMIPDGAYASEGFFWGFMGFLIAIVIIMGAILIEEICDRLREYDSPPPVLKKESDITKLLIRGCLVTWTLSMFALSMIWSSLTPEYLLSEQSFWEGVMTTIPFWFLLGVLGFIALSNEIVRQSIHGE